MRIYCVKGKVTEKNITHTVNKKFWYYPINYQCKCKNVKATYCQQQATLYA